MRYPIVGSTLLILTTLAAGTPAGATSCAVHGEAQRFAFASKVFLGQIVDEQLQRSPLAIAQGTGTDDVIAHHLDVLEVFRGEVPDVVTFRSRYHARGVTIGYGDWRRGQVGQYWLIMGGRGACTGSFEVAPAEVAAVAERFRALAADADPPWRNPDLEVLGEARQLMHVRFYPDAIAMLESLVERGGDVAEWASESLAEARSAWLGEESAEQAYREHLRAFPPQAGDASSVNPLIQLGNLIYDDQRVDEGLALLSEAVRLVPGYSHAVAELARRLDEQFLPREAEAVIQQHFDAHCRDEDFDGCRESAHWQTGELYARAGREHEAYRHLKQGIRPEQLHAFQLRKVLDIGRRIGRGNDAVTWAGETREQARRAGLHPAQLEQVDAVLAGYRPSRE